MFTLLQFKMHYYYYYYYYYYYLCKCFLFKSKNLKKKFYNLVLSLGATTASKLNFYYIVYNICVCVCVCDFGNSKKNVRAWLRIGLGFLLPTKYNDSIIRHQQSPNCNLI